MEDNDDFTNLSIAELVERQAKRYSSSKSTTYTEWCKRNNRKPFWEKPNHV